MQRHEDADATAASQDALQRAWQAAELAATDPSALIPTIGTELTQQNEETAVAAAMLCAVLAGYLTENDAQQSTGQPEEHRDPASELLGVMLRSLRNAGITPSALITPIAVLTAGCTGADAAEWLQRHGLTQDDLVALVILLAKLTSLLDYLLGAEGSTERLLRPVLAPDNL